MTKAYGTSFENLTIACLKPMGDAFVGRRVRMSEHAMSNIPEIKPAFARAAFANPMREKRLLSMIGWMMEPREDPDATMVMASARRLRK